MSKRLTNDEFIARSESFNPNLEILGEYTMMSEKILVRCKVCGREWGMLPQGILKGNGCKKCREAEWVAELAERRTKTHEQFVEELHGINPNITVIGTYTKAANRVEVMCNQCGRSWMAFPGNLLTRGGCKECSKMERRIPESEIVSRLAERNPDVELVGEYVLTNSKALFRCRKCGNEWRAVVSSVLRGTGCPACVGEKISASHMMSHADYAAEFSENNPELELLSTYVGSSGRVDVRCRKCGYEWSPKALKVLRETGCPRCAGNMRHTHDEFVAIVNGYHPDVEIIGKYVNVKTRVDVRCGTCGYEWSPLAGSLLAGSGCINCAGKLKKTHAQFVDELLRANPNVEAIGEYDGANYRMEFRCKVCGEKWSANAGSVLGGSGCPRCSVVRGSFFEHALLFALRSALGTEKVLSRDKAAIGMELDVYVPSMSLAFEPGSWYYHKSRGQNDATKWLKCRMYGIELVTIYTGCPDDEAPEGAVTTELVMSVQQWPHVMGFIEQLMMAHGIDASNVDWEWVRTESIKFAGRRTTESFKRELAEVNPNVEVLGEYVTARDKIAVRCIVCGHEWDAVADGLLQGHGCRKCAANATGERCRISHEEFLSRASEASPSIEVLGEYAGTDAHILVRCRECGREWEALAYNVSKGCGCAACNNTLRKTNEQFLAELSERNPTVTPLEEYVSGSTRMLVRCETCGHEWRALPAELVATRMRGCPECGKLKSAEARKKTHEQFVDELARKNPTIVAVGRYEYARQRMEFRCTSCGSEFMATPDNMLRGKGCPSCRYKRAADTRRKNAAARTSGGARRMNVDFSAAKERVSSR